MRPTRSYQYRSSPPPPASPGSDDDYSVLPRVSTVFSTSLCAVVDRCLGRAFPQPIHCMDWRACCSLPRGSNAFVSKCPGAPPGARIACGIPGPLLTTRTRLTVLFWHHPRQSFDLHAVCYLKEAECDIRGALCLPNRAVESV